MFHTVRSYFYVLRIYRLFSHFTYIAILLLIFLLLICRSSFKGGGAVSETRVVNTLPRYFCSASFLELCDQKHLFPYGCIYRSIFLWLLHFLFCVERRFSSLSD